ncbi:hypothetical protein EVA_08089 [gut metagenome]|uniref:Uncharacterized protein n=1 Tax=gut metagenome TaxID=749906 RepID=J9GAD7_9ZZZZ
MGITKISVPGHTGWQSGFTMCGKPARSELLSVFLLTGDNTRPLLMPFSGQVGSGEVQRCGIKETPVRKKGVSVSRLNILCGAVTDRCLSAVRCPVFPVCSAMEIPRTVSM